VNKEQRRYDFPYAPVPRAPGDDDGEGCDLIVATARAVDPDAIVGALEPTCGTQSTQTLVAHAPLFWTRVRTLLPCRRGEIAAALARVGVPVRYVASARRHSLSLPPPLDSAGVGPFRPTTWKASVKRPLPADPESEGRWFLRVAGGGAGVDRIRCGTGAGTRLAVIDDDAADFDLLELDATVPIGVAKPTCASGHGALLVGWSVGARTYEGPRFAGVAPDASVRAYLLPREDDVFSLPLAIARAAIDGADVILCATYVEGTTSPMLDDALGVASRHGRSGRGSVVVLPAGRETSSAADSVHASLSLALGDPASDPRVVCIVPGGRDGGWFLWREQRGRLRPFANRGPAVRWLAPGDDMAYPFLARERLCHAESSGAAAIAAGVLLLVLAKNPSLRLHELCALVTRCAGPPVPLSRSAVDMLADPADVLPLARDRDGHDAKHGYGRLDAGRACAAAGDPVALELVSMGEDAAAIAWCDARRSDTRVRKAYTRKLARWAVRALLADATAEHDLRVVLRHLRLVAMQPRRAAAHAPGAIARHVTLLLRTLARDGGSPRPSRIVRGELEVLERVARAATASAPAMGTGLENTVVDVFVPTYGAERASTAHAEAVR
jgi:subtilase family protein